jgi:hypothetical protein
MHVYHSGRTCRGPRYHLKKEITQVNISRPRKSKMGEASASNIMGEASASNIPSSRLSFLPTDPQSKLSSNHDSELQGAGLVRGDNDDS